MNYQEFLDYIYIRYSGNVKLGLERMYGILEAMGNPQDKLTGIHIAGTNGKGSTSATSEALALAHGLKTGLNTSPHLIDYCERFRVNGKQTDFQDILRLFKQWEQVFTDHDASFFEITTAIAFYLFYEEKVDTAIMEVGLGGRLDGTNPFRSTVSVITTIALDHLKTLGGTVEKIAYEKAGIIKTDVPLVIGKIQDSPKNVILQVAQEHNVEVFECDKDFTVSHTRITPEGTYYDYAFPRLGIDWKEVKINLLGEHQAYNTSLALTAFLLYCEKQGILWSEATCRQGLNTIYWKGRMQIVHTDPLVIVDGAHNEEGILALQKNLPKLFPDKKFHLVTSILADKQYDLMLKDLATIATKMYLAQNTSDRAATVEQQVAVIKTTDIAYVGCESVQAAITQALTALPTDAILVICGSLYTVGEAITYFQQ